MKNESASSSSDWAALEWSARIAGDPLTLFDVEKDVARDGGTASNVPAVSDTPVITFVGRKAPKALETPAVTRPAPAAKHVDPSDGHPIGLDHVLQRSTHVLWAEAVAIVEALCAVLMDAPGTELPVPDELSDILITAHGTVQTRKGARQGPPGPRLARTLLALTTSATTPVPLRLFITKWVSVSDAHSIGAYAEELAYFARPDGAALIQAVYQRCLAAPLVAQVQEPEAPTSAPPAKQAPRRQPKPIWFAAAAVIVSAACAVLVWLWGGSMAPPQQGLGGLLNWLSARTPALSQALVGGSNPVVPSTSPSERPPAAPARGSVPRSAVSASPRSLTNANRAQLPRLPAPDLPLVTAGPSSPVRMADGVSAALPIITIGEVQFSSTLSDPDDAEDPSRIYSSADPDVQPPGMLEVQLPQPLLQGFGTELNTMELVISEKGTVERVRLVSPPKRMPDMMLLSGAKTWKFEPASREGRSVRYRLLLSWTATP